LVTPTRTNNIKNIKELGKPITWSIWNIALLRLPSTVQVNKNMFYKMQGI